MQRQHGWPFLTAWIVCFVSSLVLRALRHVVPRRRNLLALIVTLRHTLFAAVIALPIGGFLAAFGGNWDIVYSMSGRSDLHRLVEFQDSVRAARGDYVTDRNAFGPLSTNVILREIVRTPDGWAAAVLYEGTKLECAVFDGSTPHPPATVRRQSTCRLAVAKKEAVPGLLILAAGFALAFVAELARSSRPSSEPAVRHP